MITFDHPCTITKTLNGETAVDDMLLVNHKPVEEAMAIIHWIATNLQTRANFNEKHTSYGLKHLLEEDTGIYVTNNEFKDAMLYCNFKPKDYDALNWVYKISEDSKAFDRYKKGGRK